MKKHLIPALAVLAMVSLAGSAQAQFSIPVPNFSFESPGSTSSSNPFVSSPGNDTEAPIIDGWTASMSNGNGPNNNNSYGLVNNSVLTSPGTADGSQSAIMQVYYNGNFSTLTTTNSLGTIAANTTYTLTVAIGALNAPSTFDGTGGTAGEQAAQADFSLLGDGTVFATSTVANTDVTDGTLTDYTLTFTTGASGGPIGEALTIQLQADKAFYPNFTDPGDESVLFDNVRLTETPEPSTWALMLGGAGFLVLLARRNVRKA